MNENSETEELERDAEFLSYALAKIFAQRGEAKEVAVLADAKPTIKQTDYDNWDGGTFIYCLFLKIGAALYAQIEDESAAIGARILEKAETLFRIDQPQDRLRAVIIGPGTTEPDPDWREKAKAWVNGKGLTNQGRVRSNNIARKTQDGLLFRSNPEILLYEALKSVGVSFAPLPVFIKGGHSFQRMEPDFIVIKNGVTLQIEVDGDTVHTETPAEAQTRVAMLEDEGVHVQRFAASECDTAEKARMCARKIVEKIDKKERLR